MCVAATFMLCAAKWKNLSFRSAEIPLPGAHNVENVLAAITTSRLSGVSAKSIGDAVRSFKGVEHRLEFVAEISGVRYYNDSKATNVDATLKALDAFSGKNSDYFGVARTREATTQCYSHCCERKAILALLIGAASEKIETQITDSVAIERAGTLARAVELASQAAQPGDIVLLAPACASFDQFQNYEQRGPGFQRTSSRAGPENLRQFSGEGVNHLARRSDTDRWLFGVTLVLCLVGAVMIFSASAVTAEHQYGHSYIFVLRQIAWLVIGLLGMFALMKLDYHKLREPAVVYSALCFVVVMLIGAFFLDKSHATHRWIKLGPVNIQPSELAKLAVILYLAWFLDLKRRTLASLEFNKQDFMQTILPAVAPILVCVALILAQPDLGTSVDIVLIMTAILFVAGLSWKWLVVGAATAAPVLFLAITHVSYRQARLMAFLHPDTDPQGAGVSTPAIVDRGRLWRVHWCRADGKQAEALFICRRRTPISFTR